MAERPNNDIEKQLRDYAAQRREAAGTPELHPATRQLLQTEVKQQYPTSSRGAGPRGWYVLWPRLAMALSVLAVIAVVMVVNEKSAKQFELAKGSEPMRMPDNTSLLSAESTLAPKRDAGIASAGEDRSDKAFAATDADIDRTGREDLAKDMPSTTFAATAAPSVASAPEATAIASKGGYGGSSRPASAKSAAISADAESNRQLAGAINSDGIATPVVASQQEAIVSQASQAQQAQSVLNSSTQRFRNTESQIQTRARGGATQAVLDEFVVEQNGSELKIVDRDGSVYNGYVRPATETEAISNFAANSGGQNQSNLAYTAIPNQAGEASSATNSIVADANVAVLNAAVVQELGAGQNFVFAVEGTNRSLQQRVVFNGNLIQNTGTFATQNAPVNSQNNQNYRRQEQSMPIQNAVNQQLRNNYINGRVYLGNSGSGMELNALSTDQ